MSKKLLHPSMMCANYASLKEEIKQLEESGIDSFHIDIMDGNFVPNYGMGLQDFECIRKTTKKMIDVHLMIEEPKRYIKKFTQLGADVIYIHPEAEVDPANSLSLILEQKKQAGIAINPSTPLYSVKELLPLIDYLMIMTVYPGFSGQSYLEYTENKIVEAIKMTNDFDFKVVVDGAISEEKIKKLGKLGVDGFVLGTSSLFGKSESYKEIVSKIRNF